MGAAAIAACGQEEERGSAVQRVEAPPSKPAVILPAPSVWETPLEDPELEAGRVVWTGTCITCHSTGLGGAPLIGNKTLWGPRIEKGLDTLFGHAMNGFYGDVGEMPARGGNAELSDDQIRQAVRFMVTAVDR